MISVRDFRKTETEKHKQNWVRLNMRTRETYSFPRQFSRNIFHFSVEIEKKFQYRQCVFFFFLFFFCFVTFILPAENADERR